MKMIQNSSTSFSQIKQDITAYLETLENWESIQDRLQSSNITIITELLAGFGSYVVYKYHKLKDETYLSTAKLESSIYRIARTFGYGIKRYTAPAIKIRYNGIPTKRLRKGDVLGSYGDYDLIYFGEDKLIEKLDQIEVHVGKLISNTVEITYVDNILRYSIEPAVLKSVDDNLLVLKENSRYHEVSKDVEDYVVMNSIVDYSLDPYSTELLCSDRTYGYGLTDINPDNTFTMMYVETDGEVTSINQNDVKFDGEFTYYEVVHLGTSGQTIDQIKQLVPLFYSTQRRMVTARDHKFVAESHQMVKAANAVRDDGKEFKYKLTVLNTVETGDLIDVMINGVKYVFNLEATTYPAMVTEISTKIGISGSIEIKETDTTAGTITFINSDTREPNTVDIYAGDLTFETVEEGVVPRCCTVHIYYVKYNVVDDPILLTYYEQLELSRYLKRYAMVGTRIVLIPAERVSRPLNIKVKLTDSKLIDTVTPLINALVAKYELKLDISFDPRVLLSEISQISLLDDLDAQFYPIEKVYYDVDDVSTLAVVTEPNQYIKFDYTGASFL